MAIYEYSSTSISQYINIRTHIDVLIYQYINISRYQNVNMSIYQCINISIDQHTYRYIYTSISIYV